MHRICIASGSIMGLFVFGEIVGSSYVMVSTLKWASTCVSGNGHV